MDPVAQGSPIHIMTPEAEAKAESGVSWCTDIRRRHRHLQNGLEARGKLVDRSGPTGSKGAGGRCLSGVCMGVPGKAAAAGSTAQRFGTWALESDRPVSQSWPGSTCPLCDLQHAAGPLGTLVSSSEEQGSLSLPAGWLGMEG